MLTQLQTLDRHAGLRILSVRPFLQRLYPGPRATSHADQVVVSTGVSNLKTVKDKEP